MPEAKEKIFLGDQSPGMGGLLRAAAAEKIPGAEVTYVIQDADAPWKATGSSVAIVRSPKWPDYWATATRNAWSPNTPNHQSEGFRSSVGAPMGLVYLAGPSGGSTFHSERENAKVLELSTEMLVEEVTWARKVAELMGKTEGVKKADAMLDQLAKEKMNVYQSTKFIANEQGLSVPIDAMVDLFTREPVRLSEHIPPNNYWLISALGHRSEWDGKAPQRGSILLPKGHALPLELAAKGYRIGYTGMSYKAEMLAMRDQFVPGLEVKMMNITFKWDFDGDNPLKALEAFYIRKNLERPVPKTVSVDTEIFEGINKYWMGRPTSISWLILGGKITPEFEYENL